MPQMSPMWWTLLMATFMMEMDLIKSMIYFNWEKKEKKSKQMKMDFK